MDNKQSEQIRNYDEAQRRFMEDRRLSNELQARRVRLDEEEACARIDKMSVADLLSFINQGYDKLDEQWAEFIADENADPTDYPEADELHEHAIYVLGKREGDEASNALFSLLGRHKGFDDSDYGEPILNLLFGRFDYDELRARIDAMSEAELRHTHEYYREILDDWKEDMDDRVFC